MENCQSPINGYHFVGGPSRENWLKYCIDGSLKCLREKIIKEIEGKELCARNLYFFKDPINSSEVEIAGFHRRKYSKEEIRQLYIQEIKWLATNYKTIITVGEELPREIITGIHFPEIELKAKQNVIQIRKFFDDTGVFSTIIKPTSQMSHDFGKVLSTNVFVENKGMISSGEVEQYLEAWLNPELYTKFIGVLLPMIDSYQFADDKGMLSCIGEFRDMYYSWKKENKVRKRV